MTIDFRPDARREIERLKPIALELAHRAGDQGITVSNIRLAAVNAGILTGEEQGRSLSWLSKVCEKAGLVKTGSFRRSDIPKAHGNLNAVWVAPEFAVRRSA